MVVKGSIVCYVACWRGVFLQGGRGQSFWNSETSALRSLPHGNDLEKVYIVEHLESINKPLAAREVLNSIYDGRFCSWRDMSLYLTEDFAKFKQDNPINSLIAIKEIANVPTTNPLQPR